MLKIRYVLLLLICFSITNCKNDEFKFPIEKRYWDLNDYDEAIRELRFGYEQDEKLPTLDNPSTKVIVLKLTDEENYKVVLEDEELGLKHRNDVATKFFEYCQDMTKIYNQLDRKDNYIYDVEMVTVQHFGLGLQQSYFKLGNEQIKERADDPNSLSVKSTLDSNIRILIDNYLIYLDIINQEGSLSDEGKKKLAEGIDKYFGKLVSIYPKANFSAMKRKAELMLKKSKSEVVKSSLTKLIQDINSASIEASE
jgi:hypothetical protein